jgi:hypothetical protein
MMSEIPSSVICELEDRAAEIRRLRALIEEVEYECCEHCRPEVRHFLKAKADTCTCYPGEGPLPCPRKFALRDCWRSAVLDETQGHIVRLKNRDRRPDEELLLNYLKRVRCALEFGTSERIDEAL